MAAPGRARSCWKAALPGSSEKPGPHRRDRRRGSPLSPPGRGPRQHRKSRAVRHHLVEAGVRASAQVRKCRQINPALVPKDLNQLRTVSRVRPSGQLGLLAHAGCLG